jgi:DNA end-binding protein Ku
MARPYWSGPIVISLVSFSVKLFVATEARSQIAFHQLSRATGERVKYRKSAGTDEDSAPTTALANDDIVKGYEYRKGQYVTIEPADLANLRVPSKHSLDVAQFVPASEIDPAFYEKPYFVVPDDDTQAQAFAVVRQALLDTGKVAISKIAFAGREHIVAIAPAPGNGMMAYTLRYKEELRDASEYFRDIQPAEIDEDSLDLAKQLIKRRSTQFDPAKFVDGYEAALKELIQAKIDHAPIPHDDLAAPKRGKVVSLMDALRKSIGTEAEPAAPSKKPAASKGPTLVQSDPNPVKHAKRKSA